MEKVKKSSLLNFFVSTCISASLCFSTGIPAVNAEEYGVDVSRYQGDINWSELAQSGMSFVILRTGTTKYGVDSRLDEYYQGTREQGIKTGAYLYVSSMTLEEFKAAAEQFVSYLDGRDWEMPVYIDLEDEAQTALGKQKLTTYALACMNIIQDAGYTTGLYSNLNWLRNYIDKEQVEKAGYEIWYAQYPAEMVNPLDYDKSDMGGIWQYSSHGRVPGIPDSFTDLNIAYKTYHTDLEVNRAGNPWLVPYLSRKTMKAGPGFEYGDLMNIPQNTVLSITETVTIDSVDWGKFSYGGYSGWCCLDGAVDYSSAGVPEDPYLCYDVNLDGNVDAADESALTKYIMGDETEGLCADLNSDGKTNIFDRMRLMAFLAGSEE